MKRGIAIIILLTLLLFSLVFSYNFFTQENLFNRITGKQIFLDDNFEQPASSFKSGRSGVLLSPGFCYIEGVYFSKLNAKVGDTVNVVVKGRNCYTTQIKIDILEHDPFFEDYFTSLEGNFSNGLVFLEWKIDEETANPLLEELFEKNTLEAYARVSVDNQTAFSIIFPIYDKDVSLSPNISLEGKSLNELDGIVIYLALITSIIFGIVIAGGYIMDLLIRKNVNHNN